MPKKIIQLISMPPNHILALDSDGVIYWRSWNKKGWAVMEQVPLTPDPASSNPNPTPSVPSPALQMPTAVGLPPAQPTINAPVIIPQPTLTMDPA